MGDLNLFLTYLESSVFFSNIFSLSVCVLQSSLVNLKNEFYWLFLSPFSWVAGFSVPTGGQVGKSSIRLTPVRVCGSSQQGALFAAF